MEWPPVATLGSGPLRGLTEPGRSMLGLCITPIREAAVLPRERLPVAVALISHAFSLTSLDLLGTCKPFHSFSILHKNILDRAKICAKVRMVQFKRSPLITDRVMTDRMPMLIKRSAPRRAAEREGSVSAPLLRKNKNHYFSLPFREKAEQTVTTKTKECPPG